MTTSLLSHGIRFRRSMFCSLFTIVVLVLGFTPSCAKTKSTPSKVNLSDGEQTERPSYVFPLSFETDAGEKGNCSITFLSEHFFITAAHCLWGIKGSGPSASLVDRALVIHGRTNYGGVISSQLPHENICSNANFENAYLVDNFQATPYDLAIGFTGSVTSMSELQYQDTQISVKTLDECKDPHVSEQSENGTTVACKPQWPNSADITQCHIDHGDFSFDQIPGKDYALFSDQMDSPTRACDSSKFNEDFTDEAIDIHGGPLKRLSISGFSFDDDLAYKIPYFIGRASIPVEGIFAKIGVMMSQVPMSKNSPRITGGDSGAPLFRCHSQRNLINDVINPDDLACTNKEVIGINSIFMKEATASDVLKLSIPTEDPNYYYYNVFTDVSGKVGLNLRKKTLSLYQTILDDYKNYESLTKAASSGATQQRMDDFKKDKLTAKGFGACKDDAKVEGGPLVEGSEYKKFVDEVALLDSADWASGSCPLVDYPDFPFHSAIKRINDCQVNLLRTGSKTYIVYPTHCDNKASMHSDIDHAFGSTISIDWAHMPPPVDDVTSVPALSNNAGVELIAPNFDSTSTLIFVGDATHVYRDDPYSGRSCNKKIAPTSDKQGTTQFFVKDGLSGALLGYGNGINFKAVCMVISNNISDKNSTCSLLNQYVKP